MLTIIKGRSGSGKTAFITSKLRLLAEAGKPCILLVPEQCSFAAEREVLAALGPQLLQNVEVLSFARLCERIFRQTGFPRGERINESGRTLLIRQAVEELKDSLKLYTRSNSGFLTLLSEFIAQAKTRCISPEDLIAAEVSGTLKAKLKELALIYAAYEALTAQTGADPRDDIDHGAERLKGSRFFEGYSLFFDSFEGFSEQEYGVLKELFMQTESVYISLTLPPFVQEDTQSGSIFSPVFKTEARLKMLAKECGLAVAAAVELQGGNRFKAPALKVLEQGIFQYSGVSSQDSQGVRILAALSPYQECEAAAAEISRLVREKGFRYRDIAIITRDFESYASTLELVFKKYNIPLFMDTRASVEAMHLFRFVLTALKCITGGLQGEELLRLAKTGLLGLDTSAVALLENYVLLWRISGRGWREPFKQNPHGFASSAALDYSDELERLNSYREAVIAPLLHLEERAQADSTGAGLARALYLMLEEAGVGTALAGFSAKLCEQGDEEAGDLGLRSWELLMDLLDEAANLIGASSISLNEFAELLQLMVASSDMGFIPQGLDEVTAGSAERIRPDAPKIVWVLGLNEGVFPARVSSGILINDKERGILEQASLNLFEPIEETALKERFLVYKTLSYASERLYLSFSKTGRDGSAQEKSEVIAELKSIFTTLSVEEIEGFGAEFFACSPASAFERMAAGFKEHTPLSRALQGYFNKAEAWSGKSAALEAAASRKPAHFENDELARSLFGQSMRLSATRVDSYHDCRFKYFCKYGIKANPRTKADFDPMQYGLVVHDILEKLIKRHGGKGLTTHSSSELKAEVLVLLEAYLEEKLGGAEGKSPRFMYQFFRVADTAALLLARMGREFAQSEFEPVDFELPISDEAGAVKPIMLQTAQGGSIAVKGVVDRVDKMERNGISYIRIVDYKTGSKEFKLDEVLYGLNLQMLIYLTAIWQNGGEKYGKVRPAGVLYLNTKPTADKKSEDGIPTFNCSGLILNDIEVLQGMEQGLGGVFIPVASKKDGAFKSYESLASLEEMGVLARHIEDMLKSMAESLHSGSIEAEPFNAGERCELCDYRAVCGHEEEDGGRPYNKFDRDAVFEMLGQAANSTALQQ
ncbi:MAG: PD-(D/E)XK nuclease family protein [Oscillospiraceae bacterium]|jgi:ATP-dependent helicase/nuclease subunit B|nr:PD-(D/E)XK nuclease family protein [Oscillospiraceae bacterium]